MEQHKQAPETAPQPSAAGTGDREIFEQFMSAFNSLKELDLTDIEPLLPPTYKESRYKKK